MPRGYRECLSLNVRICGKRTLRSYGRQPDLFANSLSTAVQSPA
jgi:hypothetical protein